MFDVLVDIFCGFFIHLQRGVFGALGSGCASLSVHKELVANDLEEESDEWLCEAVSIGWIWDKFFGGDPDGLDSINGI